MAQVDTTPEHMTIQLTKQAPLEKSRTTYEARPENVNAITAKPGQKIKIRMADADRVLDLQHSALVFKLSGSIGTAGTGNSRFTNYAASGWIRSLRVLSGGKEIEQITDYNVLHRAMASQRLTNEYQRSYGQHFEGIGQTADLESWFTNGKQFVLKPLGMLSTDKYLPLPLLSNIEIEIEMEDPENFIVYPTDGATPSYTVEYIRYDADLVELNDNVMKTMKKQAEMKGVDLHYSTYVVHSSTIQANTRQYYNFGTMLGSVKDIQVVQILDADRDANNEEHIPSFKLNNLSRYNIMLGNKNLRESPVLVSSTEQAEALYEHLKSQHLYPNINIGSENLTDFTTSYVVGQQVDVSRNPDTINSQEELFNNSIQLTMEYSTTPSVGQAYVCAHLDRTLTFLSNRLTRVE